MGLASFKRKKMFSSAILDQEGVRMASRPPKAGPKAAPKAAADPAKSSPTHPTFEAQKASDGPGLVVTYVFSNSDLERIFF